MSCVLGGVLVADSGIHFTFDSNRVKEGNLYPVYWYSFDPKDYTTEKNFEHTRRLQMFPISHLSKADLKKKAKDLGTTGYQLRDNPITALTRHIDWESNPNNDANWQFKLNAWDMLTPFFHLYTLTEQNRWLDIPLQVIEGWVDHNLIENKPNSFKWQDMATGLRAVQLAILLRSNAFAEYVPAQRAKIYYAAQIHVRVLKRKSLLSQGNHGLFQLTGLMMLCLVLQSDTVCDGAGDFAQREFAALVATQFSNEGIHLEHSSQYHIWAIQVLQRIQGLDLFDNDVFERVSLAKRHAKWFFLPDGRMTLFGDSERKHVSRSRHLSDELAFLFDNAQGVQPEETTATFADSGFTFFRDKWQQADLTSTNYLAVSAGFHSRVHKQRDDFTFEWFSRGSLIISDSGKYSYDDNELSRYFRSRRAHNTVTIDSEFSWLSYPQPYGSAVVGSGFLDSVYWVELFGHIEHTDVAHRRFLVLAPSKWLIVLDKLSAEQESDMTQWLHFEPGLSVQILKDRAVLRLPDEQALHLQHWSSESSVRNHYIGEDSELIAGWISETYKKREKRHTLSFTSSGKELVLASVFTFDKPMINPQVRLSDPHRVSVCWGEQSKLHGIIVSSKNTHNITLCSDISGQYNSK